MSGWEILGLIAWALAWIAGSIWFICRKVTQFEEAQQQKDHP